MRQQVRAAPPADANRAELHHRSHLSVRLKYTLAWIVASTWCVASVWLSQPWLHELALVIGRLPALGIITFIAYVPGFMNAFLIVTIVLDERPLRSRLDVYPDLTILIACFNEADSVGETIHSLVLQEYAGRMRVLILDDGSTDATVALARSAIAKAVLSERHSFEVVTGDRNVGKAGALNRGLAMATTELVMTMDGDGWVYHDAIRRIVERYVCDPPNTRAVAGAILVRNSRHTWLTRAQEWDYFHGIAAVKRMQSMYHGTLVAQGAFSIYDRATLNEVGGWPECVGEDIVLTWALLSRGYRVGYCEDALLFTNVPDHLRQFARQRQRWSRGLMEAFHHHSSLLFKPRMTTLFIWWNLLFVPLDVIYTFAFIPGVIMALFGYYYLAGLLTLLVLPLAAMWNFFIYRVQRNMFNRQNLKVRRNPGGMIFYMLGYSLVMQPVCVWGYVAEFLGWRKHWGTK
jgi:biofilm PGA synthesis N-glycosyltransferase PgaC